MFWSEGNKFQIPSEGTERMWFKVQENTRADVDSTLRDRDGAWSVLVL